MKTVFCPLCNSGMATALKEEKKKGWKLCPHCGEPSYIEVSEKTQNAISLKETLYGVMQKPAGKDLIVYLIKNEDNAMSDLLFNSSKGLQGDIDFLASIEALNKTIRGYSINPELKTYFEKYYQKI